VNEKHLVCSERQSSALGETLKSFVCVVLEDPVIAVLERLAVSTRCYPAQQSHTSTSSNGWLVGWCLIALSAQKGYTVPCEN